MSSKSGLLWCVAPHERLSAARAKKCRGWHVTPHEYLSAATAKKLPLLQYRHACMHILLFSAFENESGLQMTAKRDGRGSVVNVQPYTYGDVLLPRDCCVCWACPRMPALGGADRLCCPFDSRTALIVGGGDGVGKLHDIATKVSARVGSEPVPRCDVICSF